MVSILIKLAGASWISATGDCAHPQMNGVHLIATGIILVAVGTFVTNLVSIIQVHCKGVVQQKLLTTFFTIRKLVLRTNIIITSHWFTGVWINES